MLPNESQPTSNHNYLKHERINIAKNCLNKELASDIFDHCFEMINHSMKVRSNKNCLKLAPVKFELLGVISVLQGVLSTIVYQLILGKLILSMFLRKKFLNSLNKTFYVSSLELIICFLCHIF